MTPNSEKRLPSDTFIGGPRTDNVPNSEQVKAIAEKIYNVLLVVNGNAFPQEFGPEVESEAGQVSNHYIAEMKNGYKSSGAHRVTRVAFIERAITEALSTQPTEEKHLSDEQKQELFNFIAGIAGHNLMDDELNTIGEIVLQPKYPQTVIHKERPTVTASAEELFELRATITNEVVQSFKEDLGRAEKAIKENAELRRELAIVCNREEHWLGLVSNHKIAELRKELEEKTVTNGQMSEIINHCERVIRRRNEEIAELTAEVERLNKELYQRYVSWTTELGHEVESYEEWKASRGKR